MTKNGLHSNSKCVCIILLETDLGFGWEVDNDVTVHLLPLGMNIQLQDNVLFTSQ